jgi:peptide/nickel transport system substrate-binding protein
MLKGYRGPLLALVLSILLLGSVILTRPPEPTVTAAPTATHAPTALPTLTPAPTIAIQKIDTTTLHEALIGCVKKINPLLAGYNQPDRDVSSLIYEGLMTTDNYGAAVPDLAAGMPQVSSDGLNYVVALRADVLWQDGIPFTSADVEYTVRTMQNDAFSGQPDLHAFWTTVDFDVLDDHTVRFRLAQPLAAFTDYLRIGILPEHVFRGTSGAALMTHPANIAPVGTGPYQFDHFIGDGSRLTGVELHFAATYSTRPEGKAGFVFKRVVFHCEPTATDAVAAFQRGEVNSLGELPPELVEQVSGLNQLGRYEGHRPAFGTVIYNWSRSSVNFFHDARFRSALFKSVDRNKLVNQFLQNRAVVADSPILPDSWAYTGDANCPAYSVTDARADLSRVQVGPAATLAATSAATAAANKTALPTVPAATPQPSDFKFQLLVSNDKDLAPMADEIANEWKAALGIQVAPIVVDAETFKNRLVAGDFDAALVELNLAPGADPDPYSLWRQEPEGGGLNFGRLNDRQISSIVEAARRESVNGAARAQLYKDFQRAFCQRAAALLIYYPVYTYAVDRRVAGIQLGFMSSPEDRFRTLKTWQFGAQ